MIGLHVSFLYYYLHINCENLKTCENLQIFLHFHHPWSPVIRSIKLTMMQFTVTYTFINTKYLGIPKYINTLIEKYIYKKIRTYMYTYVSIHHARTHVHTLAHTHMYTHTHVHKHGHTHMYTYYIHANKRSPTYTHIQ